MAHIDLAVLYIILNVLSLRTICTQHPAHVSDIIGIVNSPRMRTHTSDGRQWFYASGNNDKGGLPRAKYFTSEGKTARSPLAYSTEATSLGLNAVFANNQASLPKWDTLLNQMSKTDPDVYNNSPSAIVPAFQTKRDAPTLSSTVYRSWSPDGTTSYSNTVGSPLSAIFPQFYSNAGVANGDKSASKAWSSNGSPLGAIFPQFHSKAVVENGDKSAFKTWSSNGSVSGTNITQSNFNDILTQMQTMSNASNTGNIMFRSWSTGYQHPNVGYPFGNNTTNVVMTPLRDTAPQFPFKSKNNESNLGQTVLKSWTSVDPNSRKGNTFGTFRTFNYNGYQNNVLGTNNSEVQNFNTLFEKLKSQASMPTSNKNFVNLPKSTSNRYATVTYENPFPSQLPKSTITRWKPHTPSLERASQFLRPSVKRLPQFITKKRMFDASRLPTAHEVEQMFKKLDLTNFKRKHLKLSSLQIQDKLKNVALKWVQNRARTNRDQPIPPNISASNKLSSSPNMDMSTPAVKTTTTFDKPLSTTLGPHLARRPDNAIAVSKVNIWQRADLSLANSRVITDKSDRVDVSPPVFLPIKGTENITKTSTPNQKEEIRTKDQNKRAIVQQIPVLSTLNGKDSETNAATSTPTQKEEMLTEDRSNHVSVPPPIFLMIKGKQTITTISTSTQKEEMLTEDQHKRVIVPPLHVFSTLIGKENEYIAETSTPKQKGEDISDRVNAPQLIVYSTLNDKERNTIVTTSTPIQKETIVTKAQSKGVIVPTLIRTLIETDNSANTTTPKQKEKILTSMKSTEDNSTHVNAQALPIFSNDKGKKNDHIAATATLKQKENILTEKQTKRAIVPPLPVFPAFTGNENGNIIENSTHKQKENTMTERRSNHVNEPLLRLVSTLNGSVTATTVERELIRAPSTQAEKENILKEDASRRASISPLPVFLALKGTRIIGMTTTPKQIQAPLTDFSLPLATGSKIMKDTHIDNAVEKVIVSKAKQTILKTTISPFAEATNTPPKKKVATSALVIASTPTLRIVKTPFKISTTPALYDIVDDNTVLNIIKHPTTEMSTKSTELETSNQDKATSVEERFKMNINMVSAASEHANASIKQQESTKDVKETIKPSDKQTSNFKALVILHTYATSMPKDKNGKNNTLVKVKSTVSPIFASIITYRNIVKAYLSTDIPSTRGHSEKGHTSISALNISSTRSERAKTLEKGNPSARQENKTGVAAPINVIKKNTEHETNIQTLIKAIPATTQDISDAETLTNSLLSKSTEIKLGKSTWRSIIPSKIIQTKHKAPDMHTTIQPRSISTSSAASDKVVIAKDSIVPHTTVINMLTREKMHSAITSLPQPPPMILDRSKVSMKVNDKVIITKDSIVPHTTVINMLTRGNFHKKMHSAITSLPPPPPMILDRSKVSTKVNDNVIITKDSIVPHTTVINMLTRGNFHKKMHPAKTSLPPPPQMILDRSGVSMKVIIKTTTSSTTKSRNIHLIQPISSSTKRNLQVKEETQESGNSVTDTMNTSEHIERKMIGDSRYNGINGQSELMSSISSVGIITNNLVIPLIHDKFNNTVQSLTTTLQPPPPILLDRHDVSTRVVVKTTTPLTEKSTNIHLIRQIPLSNKRKLLSKEATQVSHNTVTDTMMASDDIEKNKIDSARDNAMIGESEQMHSIGSIGIKSNNLIAPLIHHKFSNTVHSLTRNLPLFDSHDVFPRVRVKTKTHITTTSVLNHSSAESPMYTRNIHLLPPIALQAERNIRNNKAKISNTKYSVTETTKNITKNKLDASINNETSRQLELLLSSVVNKLNSAISPSTEGITGGNSNIPVHSVTSSIPPPPPIILDMSEVSTRAVLQTHLATKPRTIHLQRPISLSNEKHLRTNEISKSELKSINNDVMKTGNDIIKNKLGDQIYSETKGKNVSISSILSHTPSPLNPLSISSENIGNNPTAIVAITLSPQRINIRKFIKYIPIVPYDANSRRNKLNQSMLSSNVVRNDSNEINPLVHPATVKYVSRNQDPGDASQLTKLFDIVMAEHIKNGNTFHIFNIPSNKAKLDKRKIDSSGHNSDNLANAAFNLYGPYTEQKQNNSLFEVKGKHVSRGIPISILELLDYGQVETEANKYLKAILPEIGINEVKKNNQETTTQPLRHSRKPRKYRKPIIPDIRNNSKRKKTMVHNNQTFVPKSLIKKANTTYFSQLKSHLDTKIKNANENTLPLETANIQTGIKSQTRHGINILNSLLLERVKRNIKMQLFHLPQVVKENSEVNLSQSSGIVSHNVGSISKHNRNIAQNCDSMPPLKRSHIIQLFIPSNIIHSMPKQIASQQSSTILTKSSTPAVNKYSEPSSTRSSETRNKTISIERDKSAIAVLTNENSMHVGFRSMHLKERLENKQNTRSTSILGESQKKMQSPMNNWLKHLDSLSQEYLLHDKFTINKSKLPFSNQRLQDQGARNRHIRHTRPSINKFISKNKPVNTSAYKQRSKILYSPREPKPQNVIASKDAGEYIHKSVEITPKQTLPKTPFKRWNLFLDNGSSKTLVLPDQNYKKVQNDSQIKNIPTSTENITTPPRQRNTVIKKSNVFSLWDSRPTALENSFPKKVPSYIRRPTVNSVNSHPKQSQIDSSNGPKLGSGKVMLFPMSFNFR